MGTPCPPRYAEPTHERTLIFSNASHVRTDGGWYECVVPAYCNSPPYLGYSPPGEGASSRWESGWTRLASPFPCDPDLDESVGGGDASVAGSDADDGGGDDDDDDDDDAASVPAGGPAPTASPTPRSSRPSSISGALWYDANSDGRASSPLGSVSSSDLAASLLEGGAGVGGVPVWLRRCRTHELVGSTRTRPRPGDGRVRVVGADYLEGSGEGGEDSGNDYADDYDGDGDGDDDGDGGDGGGRLGYYRFHVLPSQVPGEYYVALESPPGFRITGGGGEEWEVYRSALYDKVLPVPTAEAPWLTPPPMAAEAVLETACFRAASAVAMPQTSPATTETVLEAARLRAISAETTPKAHAAAEAARRR